MAGPTPPPPASAPAATAGRLLLVVGALLLGMDVLSIVVAPPLPPVAAASAAASMSAAQPQKQSAMPGGLHVSLCTACSYKGYYGQLAAELQDKFPGLVTSASTYPATFARRAVAAIASVAQYAGLAVVLGGDKLFPALGIDPPPAWYTQRVAPRKTAAAIACWFFPNAARQASEATGAFEVFYDGEPLFSKLALSRFPSADELAVAIGKRYHAPSFVVGGGLAAGAGAGAGAGGAGGGAGGGGSSGEL